METSQHCGGKADQPDQCPADRESIGLIAGWGRYPLLIADAFRRQGRRVHCMGVRDHADPRLAELCDEFDWMPLVRCGKALRFFRSRGIRYATMAGKIHKVVLFRPRFLLHNIPDWSTVRMFVPHFLTRNRDCKDDSLLGTVVRYFGERDVHFLPATDFVPELLVKQGVLTRRKPNAGQWKDICFGWRLAKEMGRLDVGQSVAVKHQAALAVEAIEGTDECIRRAGQLCPAGGFTVVKVAKPQQDMRFDVPTIGVGTLETMVEAGAKVLAIEADRTIVIDQPEVLAVAEKHGMIVVAVDEQAVGTISPQGAGAA